MSTKRSKGSAATGGTVTGVAAGNLGTATNLDDTQVFDSSELKAAANEALAGREVPATPIPGVAKAVTPEVDDPSPPSRPPQRPAVASRVTRNSRASLPALAGLLAVVILAFVAGAGFFSQLDLGPANGLPTGGASLPAPTSTTEPRQGGRGGNDGGGGGNAGCHGRGHGNGCGGSGEDAATR